MSDLKDNYVADLDRLLEIERQLKEAKALYQEYDEIVMRLQAQGFSAAEHEGRTFKLLDNFCNSNTCFKVSFMKRYEVKIAETKVQHLPKTKNKDAAGRKETSD